VTNYARRILESLLCEFFCCSFFARARRHRLNQHP